MSTQTNRTGRACSPSGVAAGQLLIWTAVVVIVAAAAVPVGRWLLWNPEMPHHGGKSDPVELQLQVDSYYLDHDKTWPTNLQQLVPEYTDRIPRDPWGYDYQLSVLSDGTRKVRSPGLEQLRTAGNHTNVSITKPRGAE